MAVGGGGSEAAERRGGGRWCDGGGGGGAVWRAAAVLPLRHDGGRELRAARGGAVREPGPPVVPACVCVVCSLVLAPAIKVLLVNK